MSDNKRVSLAPITKLLQEVIGHGMAGRPQWIEQAVNQAIPKLQECNPAIAEKLKATLDKCPKQMKALPLDRDCGMTTVRQDTEPAIEPILSLELQRSINQLFIEREKADKLLNAGLKPTSKILLHGLPGTGKTMLARWIAHRLELPFYSVNFAILINSHMGVTGQNLLRVFDFGRSIPCVIFLDEFDSIGAQRAKAEAAAVRELNHTVNVLLKELEMWPHDSVMIAATNLTELLDAAIARRFDMTMELPLPDVSQRETIIRRTLGDYGANLNGHIAEWAAATKGKSGSDLVTQLQAMLRRHILFDESLEECNAALAAIPTPGESATAQQEEA